MDQKRKHLLGIQFQREDSGVSVCCVVVVSVCGMVVCVCVFWGCSVVCETESVGCVRLCDVWHVLFRVGVCSMSHDTRFQETHRRFYHFDMNFTTVVVACFAEDFVIYTTKKMQLDKTHRASSLLLLASWLTILEPCLLRSGPYTLHNHMRIRHLSLGTWWCCQAGTTVDVVLLVSSYLFTQEHNITLY